MTTELQIPPKQVSSPCSLCHKYSRHLLKALAATVANQAEKITTSVRTALREDIQTEIKTELQTIVKRVETKVVERLEQVEEEALATRLKIDDNTTQIQQANIRIDDLSNQIEALEQERRKSNLIVSGVPQRGKPPVDVITSFLETDLKVTSVTPVDVLTLRKYRIQPNGLRGMAEYQPETPPEGRQARGRRRGLVSSHTARTVGLYPTYHHNA